MKHLTHEITMHLPYHKLEKATKGKTFQATHEELSHAKPNVSFHVTKPIHTKWVNAIKHHKGMRLHEEHFKGGKITLAGIGNAIQHAFTSIVPKSVASSVIRPIASAGGAALGGMAGELLGPEAVPIGTLVGSQIGNNLGGNAVNSLYGSGLMQNLRSTAMNDYNKTRKMVGVGLMQNLKNTAMNDYNKTRRMTGMGLMQKIENTAMNDYNKTRRMIGMGIKKGSRSKANPHIFTQGTLINGVEVDEPNKQSFAPHEPYEYQEYLDTLKKEHVRKKAIAKGRKHKGGSFSII